MSGIDFQPFHVESDDGIRLYGRTYGRDKGELPIVCLPGLSRNSRDFHLLATLLAAEGKRVITLDYRGRGESAWDENKSNYNIMREAQDVLATLDFLGIEKAAFIGTSRGGLILHMLGAMAPHRLAVLVFNDIGPVIEAEGLIRIRDYLSVRPALSSFPEAARHLRSVHGPEFPALSDADWLDMAEAIYRDVDGVITADFDPALVEPLKTMDFSRPLPDMWQQFETLKAIPLLIIRGENSRLLSARTVDEMSRKHPNASTLIAHGQGHAPLLHLPDIHHGLRDFLNQ